MAELLLPRDVEIRHWHAFCGVGGGALGFNRGHARIGTASATMRCIGVWVMPLSVALSVEVPA